MKRWWAAYLLLGLAQAAVHLHFASTQGDTVTSRSLLLHFGIAFACYLGALRAARRLGESGRRLPVLFVFSVTVVVLLGYLHAPFLVSHEVNRYRWEGMLARQGLNPYQITPQDPDVAALREKAAFPVPNPERTGLYPPLAELTFYEMAKAGTDSVVHYRLLSSMMVLLSGLVFLPLCRAARVPITRLAVFLWHPLLLMETGLNAHIEPLAIFFLLSSLALLIEGHQLTPTGLLALATLVRGYPIIFFPLYLRRVPPYRILLFFLVILIGCVPFIAAGSAMLKGLETYLTSARHNPGLFVLFEHIAQALGHPGWAIWAAAGLGFCIALLIYILDDGSGASMLRSGFYLALPALLLGPVVVPWSVLWLIPFVALVGPEHPLKLAGLVLTGTVILGYLGGPEGRLTVPLALLEFLPPVLLAAWGVFRHVQRARAAGPLALPPAGAC